MSVGFILRQRYHFHWFAVLVVGATLSPSRFPLKSVVPGIAVIDAPG